MKKTGKQLGVVVSGEPRDEVRYVTGADADLRFVEGTGSTPPRVIGYAARFNTMSNPIMTTRGQFRERIQAGAFRSALAANDNVVFRVEHGQAGQLPLADTATRTLRLNEDAIGLRYEADLDPEDPDVQAILPKLKRGTLRSMSFAFRVAKGGDSWERRDGELHRCVMNIGTLKDVSPVTFPAYPETSLALRSLESFDEEHPDLRLLADEPANPKEVADEGTGGDTGTPAKPVAEFKLGETVVMVPSEPEYDAPWAPKGSVGTVSDVVTVPCYQIDLGGYKVFVPENRLKRVTIDPAKAAVRSEMDETETRRRRFRLNAAAAELEAEERGGIKRRKEIDPKEGTDKYGDVAFADPVNKKYPIDTEKHIRSAWNYINKGKNDEKYSADEVRTIKDRIIAAWKKEIDKDGPPSAQK